MDSTYVLFLDEFGHEQPWRKGQCPLFGYGGLLIPGHKLASFTTQFFDFKLIQLRHVYQSHVDRAMRDEAEGRKKAPEYVRKLSSKIRDLKQEELVCDEDARRLAAMLEVKGADVFSASYLAKLLHDIETTGTGKAKKDRFLRSIRRFLGLISENQTQIFYSGFHKSCMPSLNRGQRVHVELIKDVLRNVNAFARDNNTTVKVIFDHHHTDEPKEFLKSRHDRAQELIYSCGYFDNITEPVFNAKSHLSQGVQAADWAGLLVKYKLQYEAGETKPEYKEFYDTFAEAIDANACASSYFRTAAGVPVGARQLNLDFGKAGPAPTARKFQRPYHRE